MIVKAEKSTVSVFNPKKFLKDKLHSRTTVQAAPRDKYS